MQSREAPNDFFFFFKSINLFTIRQLNLSIILKIFFIIWWYNPTINLPNINIKNAVTDGQYQMYFYISVWQVK